MAPRKITIEEEALRKIVRESVHDALTELGLDTSRPTEAQKDLAYLRGLRVTMQEAGRGAVKGALWFVAIGMFVAMLVGLGVPAKVLAFMGLGGNAGN